MILGVLGCIDLGSLLMQGKIFSLNSTPFKLRFWKWYILQQHLVFAQTY